MFAPALTTTLRFAARFTATPEAAATAPSPAIERFVHPNVIFTHQDAELLSRLASGRRNARCVVIDLRHARETTTSAFARLVILRRQLRQSGRELRLAGLNDQAASLYEINRLQGVLPLAS